MERVRSEGRTRLLTEIVEPLVDGSTSPGPAFATRVGATRALDEIRRVLDLATLDEARLDALEAEARAPSGGYEVVDEVLHDVNKIQDFAPFVARIRATLPASVDTSDTTPTARLASHLKATS